MKNRNTLVTTILLTLASSGVLPNAGATDLDGVLQGANTADGYNVLVNLTSGLSNSGFGYNALYGNVNGNNNTAIGWEALFMNSAGSGNTAIGSSALYSNLFGIGNTATGESALSGNIASYNTANGFYALYRNKTGTDNTATGVDALYNNTIGSTNTGNGFAALYYNSTGYANTANGASALFNNTSGAHNTADGENALHDNQTGGHNAATGLDALFKNTGGSYNTANGNFALFNNTAGNYNTATGYQALKNNTGSNNIALGASAGINLTTGSNNIDIGGPGVATESNTIRIGKLAVQQSVYIQGISGQTAVRGAAVFVGNDGKLGTIISSARFKDDIKPMDTASEVIHGLKPVSFHYKKTIDPDRTPQFGLVAEEVEKVNPALVVHDPDGKPYTVRYEAVNAMLLNEFLKEHRKVRELETIVARQEKQIEALASGLEKVSAQLQLSRSAPQMALHSR